MISDIPNSWKLRIINLANTLQSYEKDYQQNRDNQTLTKNRRSSDNNTIYLLDNENVHPSTLGNYIYSVETSMTGSSSSSTTGSQSSATSPAVPEATPVSPFKLVCYYNSPISLNHTNALYPDSIDANLCTHINVGMVWVTNNTIVIEDHLKEMFKRTTQLKNQNPSLKVLVWVGGAYSPGFSEMVLNHANRKKFIQSLKSVLETYGLDGIDIDWEFPSAHNRERQHFSQLLHEIRREYQREHRTYLLSVAVAAPEGIVFYAYDIEEINKYADFVNIMTYDYHFYSPSTPFTGKCFCADQKKKKEAMCTLLIYSSEPINNFRLCATCVYVFQLSEIDLISVWITFRSEFDEYIINVYPSHRLQCAAVSSNRWTFNICDIEY